MRHPILVQTQRLQPDSEGAGRFRGAPGAYVEYGPVGCSIKVAYGADGVENPALGARGGLAGAPSTALQARPQRELHELPPLGLIDVKDGERIVSVTAGGGGYGPPEERAPERVRHDVAEGWISEERARNVYGVALNEALEIDEVRTRLLRGGTA